MQPTAPIFVIDTDGGDVMAFDSVTAAVGYIELPEVTDGAYVVFDAEGYEATLGADRWNTKVLGWSAEPRPGELHRVLRAFVGRERGLAGTQDADLVRVAGEVAQSRYRARLRPRMVVRVWDRLRGAR